LSASVRRAAVSSSELGKVKTRFVAWVLHPRDAKDIVIPEPKK
jgi:hypothetical protein